MIPLHPLGPSQPPHRKEEIANKENKSLQHVFDKNKPKSGFIASFKGHFKKFKFDVIQLALSPVLDILKNADQEFLKKKISDADAFTKRVHHFCSKLMKVLEKSLTGEAKDYVDHHKTTAERQLNTVMVHLFTNLVSRLHIKDPISTKEATKKLVHYLAEDLGPLLKQVDETVKKSGSNPEAFQPLAHKIFELALPKGDPIRNKLKESWEARIVDSIAEKMASAYLPYANWLSGNPLETTPGKIDLEPIQSDLFEMGTFLLENLFGDSDSQFLEEKVVDALKLQAKIEEFSPKLVQALDAFIPHELKDKLGKPFEIVMTHLLSNLLKQIKIDGQMTVEEMTEALTLHLATEFRPLIHQMDQSLRESGATPDAFKPLIQKMIDIAFPKKELIRTLLPPRFEKKIIDALAEKLEASYANRPLEAPLETTPGKINLEPIQSDMFDLGTFLLKNLFGDADSKFLAEKAIDAPKLQAKIREFSPKLVLALDAYLPQGLKEKLGQPFEIVLTHLLSNLLKEIKIDDQMSIEQMTQALTLHLASEFGPLINEMDRRVSESGATPDAFKPLIKKIIDSALPKKEWIRTLLSSKLEEKATDLIAEQLAAKYAPYAVWLSGGPLNAPPLDINFAPIQSDLFALGEFFSQNVLEEIQRDDLTFFNELDPDSQEQGVEDYLEKYVPLMSDWISKRQNLPKELNEFIQEKPEVFRSILKTLLLRSGSTYVKGVFKEDLEKRRLGAKISIPLEKILQGVSSDLLSQIESALENNEEEFSPYVLHLVKKLIPEWDPLHSFLERRKTLFTKPIGELFSKVSKLVPKEETLDHYKDRLAKIFEGSEKMAEMVKEIDQWIGTLGTAASKKGKESVQKEGFLEDALKNFDPEGKWLDGKDLPRLERGLNGYIFGKSPEVKWLRKKGGDFVHLHLLKAIVQLLEKVPKEERVPLENLMANALKPLLNLSASRFPDIFCAYKDKIKEAKLKAKEVPVTERSAFLLKEKERIASDLLAPFSTELVGLLFGEDIDLPPEFHKKILEEVSDQLKDGLAKVFVVSTAWMIKKEKNAKRLQEIYGSKNAEKLCHVIGVLAKKGAPWFITDNREKIIEQVFGKEGESSLGPVFLGLLNSANSPEMKPVWDFAGHFTETTLLGLLLDLSRSIKSQEDEVNLSAQNISWIEKHVLNFLAEANKHFLNVAEGKKRLHQLDLPVTEENLKTHQDKWHEALLDDPVKEKFYLDQSKKLLDLFQIDENQILPIPDFLKVRLFKEIAETILPKLLKQGVDVMKDPDVLNTLLISFFKEAPEVKEKTSLYKEWFKTKAAQQMGVSLEASFKGPYQDELEAAVVNLINSLIQMEPDKLLTSITKRRLVQKKAATVIGQPLRGALRPEGEGKAPLSVLTLGDAFMGKVSDTLIPTKWNEDRLEYCKTDFSGKVEGTEVVLDPDLERLFPSTSENAEKVKALKEEERIAAEENLPIALREAINKELDQVIMRAFFNGWASMEGRIMGRIDRAFGSNKEAVKRLVRFFLAGIKIVATLNMFIFNYTVWLLIKHFLKISLHHQSDNQLENVRLNLDNLIYNLFDAKENKPHEA